MTEKINHSQRAHALLSASSAHRWLECPPSAVAAEAYPNEGTEYTRGGTLAHEVAEIVARSLDAQKLADSSAMKFPEGATAEMIDNAIDYSDYIAELKTSDDAIVLLEQRVDFSAWVPDGFGTADCIIIQGDTMDIIDYKYGQGVAVSATNNPQEMLYGLGALNDYGFAYDIEHVRLHIFQPRIDNTSVFELTTAELLDWGEKVVKPTAEKAAKGKGDYKPGAHCRFCPNAGKCRALTKVCSKYVQTHDLKVRVPVLAPHEVAEVLEMEPLITLWLKRVKEQALTSMLNGEQVPGYKVVEGKLGNRKWTDELQALVTLEAAGYLKEEVTETKLLSPANMDKAIGKKKAAELLGALIDRAPGAPTIAKESDKRPAYDQKAEISKMLEAEG